MNYFLSTIFGIGMIGFLIGWSGILAGMISSFFIKEKGNRIKGTILGLLGGLTLGIVCFDLLPEAFESGPITIAVIGIVLGLLLALVLDGVLTQEESTTKNNNYFKAAVFMAIGIGIHNLPSGIALGSLLYASPVNGSHLAIALIFDAIPEGLTVGMLLRECNTKRTTLLFISILTCIPLGLGSSLGCIIRAPFFVCLSLSFAASMILYVTLRETLPSANDIWNGRLTTIGNVLGMILGLLLVIFLENL